MLIVLLAFTVICFGLGIMFGLPSLGRYQKILDARNQIEVNKLIATQTKQLIENEKQKAQIRVEEAKGIAQAQHLINATLTDQYLQHEAIEAQRAMAGSHNHTQIYIPVGNNGIPLVKTVDPPQDHPTAPAQ
jgi:hypothetical protein